MASLPASLLLVFIRGIASSAARGNACAHYSYGACVGQIYDFDTTHGYHSSVAAAGRRRGGSAAGFLHTTHASPTAHVLPSRYPMVVATASIVASTMTSSPSSSALEGRKSSNGAIRAVMAEPSNSDRIGGSSSSNGSSNKPRQTRPVPGKQAPGSSLSHHQHLQGMADEYAAPRGSSASAHTMPRTMAEAPPDTLKVKVLGAPRGKSPSCTYSLVELQNTVSNAQRLV